MPTSTSTNDAPKEKVNGTSGINDTNGIHGAKTTVITSFEVHGKS
jgi:hypothetical protein